VRAIVPVLLLAALLAPPPQGAQARDAVERRRDAIARELIQLGAELRREIERADAAALLARVPEEGLRCSGRLVPKERIARDLSSERSWLHGVFFGGPGYAPPPRTAASLAALFRTRRDVAVVVSFEPDPRAGPTGRPCLDFRAKGSGTPGAPLCFERRGERWWFTESLYPCG
jgi:hypothetical protein